MPYSAKIVLDAPPPHSHALKEFAEVVAFANAWTEPEGEAQEVKL
jgi:hypothetical protein